MAALGLLAAACGGGSSPKAVHSAKVSTTASTAAPAPVFPLTGLPVSDPTTAARPALTVKVDNVAGAFPQEGLDHADIVAEALVEGGLTRLTVTFQSQDAALVGPIRSARPVDAAILRELNGGIFAYSGAANGEIAPVKASSNAVLLSHDAGSAGFQLVHWRSVPHNLFAATTDLYNVGRRNGATWTPPPQLFQYSAAPQGGPSTQAGSATMSLSPISSAGWTWSPKSNLYFRTQNGSPDMNASGSQMSAHNIVILSTAIGPTGVFDSAGNQDPLVVLVGSGQAWVMRDGRAIQGTWSRPDISQKVSLQGPAGTITLEPGNTWMELLPRPYTPAIKP